MGNPPYSAGQKNADDENPNISYPELDDRIKNTYAHNSKTGNINSLYDSYIRSIRWASDRIGESGIISFITNGSFIRSETTAGLRECLEEEFNEIWCFDLKGNGRVTGDGRNIFEYSGTSGGTRTPVAIIFLIKNPKKKDCTIYYKGLEEKYYSGSDKRDRVKELKSIQGITDWDIIKPDRHHDWINHRNEEFYTYTPIGNKETKAGKTTNTVFSKYSMGAGSSRDVWIYNSSIKTLTKNMKIHIDYCNSQDLNNLQINSKKGKWSSSLTDRLKKHKPKFIEKDIRIGLYRPFFKQYIYFNKTFIHRMSLLPKIFPNDYTKNIVICVPYKFIGNFSIFITNITPDLEVIHHGQCFPLYTYSKNSVGGGGALINMIVLRILLTLLLTNIENIITIKK